MSQGPLIRDCGGGFLRAPTTWTLGFDAAVQLFGRPPPPGGQQAGGRLTATSSAMSARSPILHRGLRHNNGTPLWRCVERREPRCSVTVHRDHSAGQPTALRPTCPTTTSAKPRPATVHGQVTVRPFVTVNEWRWQAIEISETGRPGPIYNVTATAQPRTVGPERLLYLDRNLRMQPAQSGPALRSWQPVPSIPSLPARQRRNTRRSAPSNDRRVPAERIQAKHQQPALHDPRRKSRSQAGGGSGRTGSRVPAARFRRLRV